MSRLAFRTLIRPQRYSILAAGFIIVVGGAVYHGVGDIDGVIVSAATDGVAPSRCARLETTELPNAVWIHEDLLSGGQPDRDSGFTALRRLGIQTIISVDGIRPDVQGAREYGLRYVHLPIGYDGVPSHRAHQLARAMLDLPRPIYIHCHHGQHRGPAAAAVGCITAGLISRTCGIQVLYDAGTGRGYQGLWNSVTAAYPADTQELADLNVDYTETFEPSAMVDAMSQLQAGMETLELLAKQRSGNHASTSHVGAVHQALLLREQLTELQRVASVRSRPREFRTRLEKSRQQAALLESLLQPVVDGNVSVLHRRHLETAINVLRSQCDCCHRRFRD
ncbi:MAG: hypothetical protein ABGZ35_08885 [Planctomycetaceae bacterium]